MTTTNSDVAHEVSNLAFIIGENNDLSLYRIKFYDHSDREAKEYSHKVDVHVKPSYLGCRTFVCVNGQWCGFNNDPEYDTLVDAFLAYIQEHFDAQVAERDRTYERYQEHQDRVQQLDTLQQSLEQSIEVRT